MINMGITLTTAYHEWKNAHYGDKTWSHFKEHFNKAFNELKELNKISAGGIGFEAKAMGFLPAAIEEISFALDNLANATVQKTDTINKLEAAL